MDEIVETMKLVINKHRQVSDEQNKVRGNSRGGVLLECLLKKSVFEKLLFVNKQQISNLTCYYGNS